ncbi:hypothetical protein HHSLTHF2_23850 [Vreelandella venusta]|uniref:Sulfotransferase domain-containing protein n=1 Tax=Halomonas hydrothermalis TaxID=115561 RepID=A0A6F8U6G0_9GAMM|nr:hypothetical protein [Halomonas hydrothermalis]BCB08495.1 hypothetical protein HHSLTHF2_23850 [Halomonas hydrothermalis]
MGKLIVHAGQMKSSTTYIQKILSKNRDLLSKKGFLYPGNSENHQILFYKICGSHIYWRNEKPNINHSGLSKLVEKINYEKESGRNIVLSAEGLSSMDEKGVDFLYEALGGFDSVVFTIRSLHKTLPSAWQQTLKSGSYSSLNDFFKKLERNRKNLEGYWRTYAFGNAAKIWGGYADVRAALLPNETSSDSYSWELFCQSVGLNLNEKVSLPIDKVNSSISQNTARLMRAVSLLADSEGLNKRDVARWFYNDFVLGSKVKGDKIFPPVEFKEVLDSWNYEELALLKEHASILSGSFDIYSEFENYNGKWLDKDKSIGELTQYDSEMASHVVNFFKSKFK